MDNLKSLTSFQHSTLMTTPSLNTLFHWCLWQSSFLGPVLPMHPFLSPSLDASSFQYSPLHQCTSSGRFHSQPPLPRGGLPVPCLDLSPVFWIPDPCLHILLNSTCCECLRLSFTSELPIFLFSCITFLGPWYGHLPSYPYQDPLNQLLSWPLIPAGHQSLGILPPESVSGFFLLTILDPGCHSLA